MKKSKLIVLQLLFCHIFISSAHIPPTPPNLALNKPSFDSGHEGPFLAKQAFDGNRSTRWSSEWTDDEWICVDLQKIYLIGKTVLVWERAYGKEYKIQVSNDAVTWSDVAHITDGRYEERVITFSPDEARYVKMHGLKRGTQWGYSLWEFEVYGEEAPNYPPTDIILSSTTVIENRPAGTVVGSFSTADPNPEDTHIYSFASGYGDDDNSSFTIEGDKLKTAEVFDYDTKSSYSIRVRTTEDTEEHLFYEKYFTIMIYPTEELSLLLNRFAVYSTQESFINYHSAVKNGAVGSNGRVEIGDKSEVHGDIVSGGDAVLHRYSLIDGDVISGGRVTIFPPVEITGSTNEGISIEPLSIPEKEVTPGTENILVPYGKSVEIPPGNYNNLMALSRSTVRLSSGAYHFRRFRTEPDVTVIFTITGEDTAYVNVIEDLDLRDRTKVKIEGSSNPYLVRFYSHQLERVDIHPYDTVTASIISPRAEIRVHPRVKLSGVLYGKRVFIEPNVTIDKTLFGDSDGDGMPDWWEIAKGLNPFYDDSGEDPDSDGLVNIDEYICTTEPHVFDTDGDGLGDGEEFDYWESRRDEGLGWDSDIEPYQHRLGDGLINIRDPDSDNDGQLDGEEVNGWEIIVNNEVVRVKSDPASIDTDNDLLADKVEHDGWEAVIHGDTLTVKTNPSSFDTDGDGLKDEFEKRYGLHPGSARTFSFMPDIEWWQIVLNIGSWATAPYSAYLDPGASPAEAGILEFEFDWLFDVDYQCERDEEGESKTGIGGDFSIYIPPVRYGTPITLNFSFESPDGMEYGDYISRIIFGKTDDEEYPGHVNDEEPSTIFEPEGRQSSVSWTISDPFYLAEGHWFINFNARYDKDAGEPPRTFKIDVRYNDDTYVSMVYWCCINDTGHHSTTRQIFTVTGGSNPCFLRGETIEANAGENPQFNFYMDSIKITDYDGNLVRTIGRKAFNGYSFQFPIGSLNRYDPGSNNITEMNKLVCDYTVDEGLISRWMTHIDENGNDWNDVQITYDVSNRTSEYECWAPQGHFGNSGLALGTAVLRRGTSFRVIGTDYSLDNV